MPPRPCGRTLRFAGGAAQRNHDRPPTRTREARSPMSRLTSWLRPTTVAHAHCDIPCGIYDPSEAVLAARTVTRMVELIGKIPRLAGKNKQGVDAQAAADLEAATKEFADMFWATKK